MTVHEILTRYANDLSLSSLQETSKKLQEKGFTRSEAIDMMVNVDNKMYFQKVADKWGLEAVPAKYQYLFA